MDNNKVPTIKLYRTKEYTFKQSKYDVAPTIPFSMIITGQSGSGKTVVLSNLVLDIYRGCFERIYIWSASINADPVWSPVKHYIETVLKIDTNKEKKYFDDFNPTDLKNVIDLQQKISEYQKKNGMTQLFSTLILIDDFVDSVAFSKHNSLLNMLYIRARHFGINVISSSQKYNALSTIVRTNSRQLIFFKLRNYREVESVLDELAGVLISKKALTNTKSLHEAKQLLLEIYNMATEESYSFLFVNLMKQNINDVFMVRFDKRITIDEDETIK